MKKKISYFICFVACSALFFSCTPDNDFDEALLYGKWQDGTLYEVYNSDGTGKTWDTSDNVEEEEAKKFTWTLVKDDLTQLHIMEVGSGTIPRPCTVQELSATKLKYKDDMGDVYVFKKVN